MSTAPLSSSPDTIRACVLLLDPDGRRILTREPGGSLPAFDVPPAFYPEVEDLVRIVREECRLDIAILRCLAPGDANEGKPRLYSAICTSENVETSPGFKWIGLDEPNFDQSDRAALGKITQLEVERLSSPTLVDSPVPLGLTHRLAPGRAELARCESSTRSRRTALAGVPDQVLVYILRMARNLCGNTSLLQGVASLFRVRSRGYAGRSRQISQYQPVNRCRPARKRMDAHAGPRRRNPEHG